MPRPGSARAREAVQNQIALVGVTQAMRLAVPMVWVGYFKFSYAVGLNIFCTSDSARNR